VRAGRRRILGFVFAATASAPGEASEPPLPRVLCAAAGRCAVSRLPPTVADREVARYLRSGLTTTLLLTLSGRDPGRARLSASAAVEVRFEPWEEVFLVAVRVPGKAPERHRLATDAALGDWWRALRLELPLGASPRGEARLELVVIPFSEEEEADTRRWYAEALREAGPATSPSLGLGEALDAMTLTSIKRKGVLRFSWSAHVEPAS